MADVTILLAPSTFLSLLWILLFILWFDSESEDMTSLLAIIFIPYTIFFIWFVLPTYITHWMGTMIFVCIALIVGGYTIDMRIREKK